MKKTTKPYISAKVVIDSMRDNGYKNTAYALAELIDNSVQANANLVELLIFTENKQVKVRVTNSINKIVIFDNGTGMSPDILYSALEFGASENKKNLTGIGKFGMGLPNSSISQCRHVEVWSWIKNNDVFFTYLDIQEIKDGKLLSIPYPVKKQIPDYIVNAIGGSLPSSGTIVLWSDFDKLKWKTPSSIYKHSEALIGRMYRKFISENDLKIKYKHFIQKEKSYEVVTQDFFKANDPMYLMKNTTLPQLPDEFNGESFFYLVEEFPLDIKDNEGNLHEIRIRASIAKKSIIDRINKGSNRSTGFSDQGKHALTNIGLSVLRAGRELDLKREFIPQEDIQKGIARWYGVEISFPPALDEVFGVLNNKQDAINLRNLSKEEDAQMNGFLISQEYINELEREGSPLPEIYKIAAAIKNVINNKLRTRLKEDKYNFNTKRQNENNPEEDDNASAWATKKGYDRQEKGHESAIDTVEPSEDNIKKVYEKAGYSGKEAKEKAQEDMRNNLRYKVEEVDLYTAAFFDVTSDNGFTLVQINKNHQFYEKILKDLDPIHKENLLIAIAAWARMEDECGSDSFKNRYKAARENWGAILEDFLEIE